MSNPAESLEWLHFRKSEVEEKFSGKLPLYSDPENRSGEILLDLRLRQEDPDGWILLEWEDLRCGFSAWSGMGLTKVDIGGWYRFQVREEIYYVASGANYFKPKDAAGNLERFLGIPITARRYLIRSFLRGEHTERIERLEPAFRNTSSEYDYFDEETAKELCYPHCCLCGCVLEWNVKEVDLWDVNDKLLEEWEDKDRDFWIAWELFVQTFETTLGPTVARFLACDDCEKTVRDTLFREKRECLMEALRREREKRTVKSCAKLMSGVRKSLRERDLAALKSLKEGFAQAANLLK
jgi:hypothetical protein